MAFSKVYGLLRTAWLGACVAVASVVLVGTVVLLAFCAAFCRVPAQNMELYAERADWPPDY